MNITYSQNGDYRIPNIVIRKTKPIGHYGRLRKAYLETYRPVLFNELVLLSSREVENIFENSDYVFMLNQASGDRQILAKQLNISPHQLSYVTHSGEGEGLLFYGSTILPFVDRFPKDTELYRIITTKPQEQAG